jgi:multidrug efflux pump subunit AcrA (membrane-fusion protein)
VQLGKILQELRDRVIRGSQLGKRKLDLAFARRELDQKLLEIGERYRTLAREGRVAVPEELEGLVGKVRILEERMAREEQEVARLQREQPSET